MKSIDFKKLDYLKWANTRQKAAFAVLREYRMMEILADFEPILVGTVPLGIDLPESDLDVICCAKDLQAFSVYVQTSFGSKPGFDFRIKPLKRRASFIANFQLNEFEVELFAQDLPTIEQDAYKHMLGEYRLLQKYGEAFKTKVVDLKKKGYKTEPAFAKLLHLKGDPYQAILDLFAE
ncbi:DUF4269 domain-containing protein [Marinilongibacter aquaticus]|uniref:DUF4269 domain-containing protein n=1 Tax=Marinilongibacter aquaticus TaxID=2975157 RepID=UPI0021BD64D0|nr:DUF4269 domain-containing protein [Marinilongibacter aquaticus]UBM60896.1 DUF4269 domain-containing protein [Marinilongibacter aquaticus]